MALSSSDNNSKKFNKSKSSSALLTSLTSTAAATTPSYVSAATRTSYSNNASTAQTPTGVQPSFAAAQHSPASLINTTTIKPEIKNFNFLSKASHSYSLNKILTNASNMISQSRAGTPQTPPVSATIGGGFRMRMSDSDEYSPNTTGLSQQQPRLSTLSRASSRTTSSGLYGTQQFTSANFTSDLSNNNPANTDDDENIFYNVNNFPMSSHNKHRRRDRFLNKLGVKKKQPESSNAGNFSSAYSATAYFNTLSMSLSSGGGGGGGSNRKSVSAKSASNLNESSQAYPNSLRNSIRASEVNSGSGYLETGDTNNRNSTCKSS
jgi:hypothetical protein